MLTKDGAPVAGADISLENAPYIVLAKTDTSGKFRAGKVCAESQGALVRKDGFVPARVTTSVKSSTEATLRASLELAGELAKKPDLIREWKVDLEEKEIQWQLTNITNPCTAKPVIPVLQILLFLYNKTCCSCATNPVLPVLQILLFCFAKPVVPVLQNLLFLYYKTGYSCTTNPVIPVLQPHPPSPFIRWARNESQDSGWHSAARLMETLLPTLNGK